MPACHTGLSRKGRAHRDAQGLQQNSRRAPEAPGGGKWARTACPPSPDNRGPSPGPSGPILCSLQVGKRGPEMVAQGIPCPNPRWLIPNASPPCPAGQNSPEAGHLSGGHLSGGGICPQWGHEARWAGLGPGTHSITPVYGRPLPVPIASMFLLQTVLKLSTRQHLALAGRTHGHLLFIPRRF